MNDILDDEKDKLLSHEYDGIQELDNYLPPWWLALFYVTIVFSVVYFFGYEVFGWFRQPVEEYNHEMAPFVSHEKKIVKIPENDIFKILEQKRLEKDKKEDIIAPLMDEEDLKQGKKIFRDNCLICHGKNGEGLIGPNLTDKYWVYGKGSFEDIVHIIKTGVIEKGMQPWAATLGNKRVLQVASYVTTFQGTTPDNPKQPEGIEYP